MDEYDNDIVFSKTNENGVKEEEWLISLDIRHNQTGYRCTRYVKASVEADALLKQFGKHSNETIRDRVMVMVEGLNAAPDDFGWDESYMFFVSLDEAYKAFLSNNLKEGRAAF